MELFIKKIISGGQTGADIAGLKAAKKTGIITGGFCPKGYLTEKGPYRSLKMFNLKPTTSADYRERTELNVLHSDGTVIFSKTDVDGNITGIGTLLTQRIAKEYGKPVLINPSTNEFAEWIVGNDIRTLNVAGNRKSDNKEIEKTVYKFLSENLKIRDRELPIMSDEQLLFEKNIEEIKKDKQSGSLTMTSKLHNAILNYVKDSEEDITMLNNNLRRNLNDFRNSDTENMVLMRDFVNSFLILISDRNTGSKSKYLKFLTDFKKANDNVSRKTVRKALRKIDFKDKTIVLFSNSTTVVLLFQELASQNIYPTVIQCKSGPENEGLIQAKSLKKNGFKVKVVNDEDVVKHLKSVDFLLLGCDGYNDEVFINKRGSFFQVIKFNINKKPVYVLSDSRKYCKELHKIKTYANSMFELIPLKRVTKMITEK